MKAKKPLAATPVEAIVRQPRRTRMAVTDFVHGGYVSEGNQWMKVRLLCKTCRRETGWYDGADPVVYCDHHVADVNKMV